MQVFVLLVVYLAQKALGSCKDNCFCEKGVDYPLPNADLEIVENVADEQTCCDKCRRNKNCLSWTYGSSVQEDNTFTFTNCYLKAHFQPNRTVKSCCISGYPVCDSSQLSEQPNRIDINSAMTQCEKTSRDQTCTVSCFDASTDEIKCNSMLQWEGLSTVCACTKCANSWNNITFQYSGSYQHIYITDENDKRLYSGYPHTNDKINITTSSGGTETDSPNSQHLVLMEDSSSASSKTLTFSRNDSKIGEVGLSCSELNLKKTYAHYFTVISGTSDEGAVCDTSLTRSPTMSPTEIPTIAPIAVPPRSHDHGGFGDVGKDEDPKPSPIDPGDQSQSAETTMMILVILAITSLVLMLVVVLIWRIRARRYASSYNNSGSRFPWSTEVNYGNVHQGPNNLHFSPHWRTPNLTRVAAFVSRSKPPKLRRITEGSEKSRSTATAELTDSRSTSANSEHSHSRNLQSI